MFPWILLIIVGIALAVLFVRRMRMTQKDLLFQEHLAEEQAEEKEEAVEFEEDENQTASDLLGSVRKTFLKADTHLSRNEFEEAEPLFVAIIAENPSHLDRRGERLQSLGQVYYELGEHEKALHYFERATRRKPKDLDLKLVLADLYEKAGQTEAAEDMLKSILQADPYNKEVKARLKNL